jgi:uncharacterized membrane protein YtjA (UPF0391 family)
MPTLAITCLAISMIAAVLGVGGMSGPVGTIAELLFLVFAALFVVAVVFGGGHRPARTVRRRGGHAIGKELSKDLT